MPGRKLTGAGKKDFRVTVRLDPETYRRLSETVEQGVITQHFRSSSGDDSSKRLGAKDL